MIVTVPALLIAPAAMVNVFALDSVKSIPAPGDADTVTVVAALEARFSVAVTVDTPPFSEIEDGDNDSSAVGVSSLSVVVIGSSGCSRPS